MSFSVHPPLLFSRVDCSGRRVASLDVDGVVKVNLYQFLLGLYEHRKDFVQHTIKPSSSSFQVWSFNPIMQTKATIMSKSPLLSLEWAAKPDRLVQRKTDMN